MTEHPRNRHKTIRLPDFDYSSASTYFLTQCTFDRRFFLGDIEDGEMFLSRTGVRVWEEWDRTLVLRPSVIEHAFIVMPNHIHGLVSFNVDDDRSVESHSNATPLHRRPRSLSTLMSGFKGAVTRWLRDELGDPYFEIWQPGFHEHIVRNQKSFETIQGYILNNVAKWSEDRENPVNWDRS
jgi:REP element-mobilizing transposase RayT